MKKEQKLKAGEFIYHKGKKYLIQRISLDGSQLWCTKEFGDLGVVCLNRNECNFTNDTFEMKEIKKNKLDLIKEFAKDTIDMFVNISEFMLHAAWIFIIAIICFVLISAIPLLILYNILELF